MIDALDLILKRLLTDAVAEKFDPPSTLLPVTPVAISFDAPDEAFRNTLATAPSSILNVYLADVRENRKLRTNDRVSFNGAARSEAQAPARLDCHYLITAWSPGTDQNLQDGENVATEHRLLYSAAAALLRHNPLVARHVFGEVPEILDDLHDGTATSGATPIDLSDSAFKDFFSLDPVLRDMELPIDVMPPEGFHRIGEFWGLMGAGAIWHPSAYVIITLPIERLRTVSGPPVRSIGAIYDRRTPTSPETRFILAGTVSSKSGAPVPRARATLTRQTIDPHTGDTRVFTEVTSTDLDGRFVFMNLPAGTVDLSCSTAAKKGATVPPSDPKEYDLTLP